MAYGKAVIGTRAGGIPEVIEDGKTGVLVEPDNPSELACAMIRLMESQSLRAQMGAAGRTRFLDDFSTTAMARRTALFYADVIQEWSNANKPVWRAGPMGTIRGESTQIDWLPSSGSLWLVANPGHARTICYGPYMNLSPGIYRAEFLLKSDGPVDPETRVAAVDVFNMTLGIKNEKELHGRDFGGSAISAAVFFTVPSDVMGTYEFRVHSTGKTTLSVREIIVRQWPPQPVQPLPTAPNWSWAVKRKMSSHEVVVR
jgi:hypothetical protein